jgi:tripartite ATP-independent transporter DctP family solute receptor
LLSVLLVVGSTGCGGTKKTQEGSGAAGVVTLRLAHPYDEKQPLHQGAVKFAEIVSQKTNGKVQVKIFPNSTLGAPREVTEGIKLGTIDMGLIPTTNTAVFYNKLDLFYLPFLFANKEHAYAVSDGPVGKKLYEEFRQKTGIRTLTMYESGFRQLTNSKKPIRTPDDLAGLKIRSTDSPINVDTFKSLGVNTSPMAISELFTALQQGTMDGQDNPVGNVYSWGYYKVQKHLTLTRHQWAGIMMLISDKQWNKLSPEYQKIIQEAAAESAAWERKEINQKEGEFLDAMKKEGMQVVEITPAERKQFQDRMQAVWDKYQDKIGKDIIDATVKTKY